MLASGQLQPSLRDSLDNSQRLERSRTLGQVGGADRKVSTIDQQMNGSLDLTLCELEMHVDQQLEELKQLERDYCSRNIPPTPSLSKGSTIQSELRASIVKKLLTSQNEPESAIQSPEPIVVASMREDTPLELQKSSGPRSEPRSPAETRAPRKTVNTPNIP